MPDLKEVFPLYSSFHIIQIVFMIVSLGLAFILFRNKKQIETKLYIVLTAIVYACVIGITIYASINGINYLEWLLPFHICNLFYILLPIMAFSKGKIRDFFKDYSVYFGFLGCVLCIVIPANTQVYFEAYHPISMLVYLHHLAIGILSIYLISSKVYVPKIANLWRMLFVAIPLVTCAFIANYFLGTDFCFMNPEVHTYPLVYIGNYLGKYYSYVLFSLVIMLSLLAMSMLKRYKILKKRSIINQIAFGV